MGCGCGTSAASTTYDWEVRGPDNVYLGSHRTEVEAAVAAARTPGATYRPIQVA